VVLAAALGAVVGAAAIGAFSKPAIVDATAQENKATQQSVARLAQEITSLKASLEAASKSANSQIAKISERLNRESAGVTNSITPPQTVAPASQVSAPSRLPAAGESRSSRLQSSRIGRFGKPVAATCTCRVTVMFIRLSRARRCLASAGRKDRAA
jgi:hypothetical protein